MPTHSTDGATGVNALGSFLDGLSETINRNVYNAGEVTKLVGSMFRIFEHSESEFAWQELASDEEFCKDWKIFSTKFNELSSKYGDSFGDELESKELKCYVDSLRSTIASKFTREPI
ncbi:hypothetical protein OIDMADRAFT_178882 [Oidiodendron maius Zn]|uniref:Uncharacterized protein n=1 Tax=Oidiodendron maius (strain Zn) TaxID=913774 RepID=A0A0C3H4Z7_OIDMZ|nr:hypothetical protein OIDMADRAFT_178882 [Oidiodendron maius Zn]